MGFAQVFGIEEVFFIHSAQSRLILFSTNNSLRRVCVWVQFVQSADIHRINRYPVDKC